MKLTAKQEEQLIADFKNGDTPGVLSRRFHVSPSTVRNVFKPRGPGKLEPLSTTAEDKIIDMYQQGLSTRAVARNAGVAPSTVLKVLNRNGHKPRKQCRPCALDENQRLDVAIMYEDGHTMCDVAGEFNISTSTVQEYLKEFNVVSRTGWSKFKTEKWTDRKGMEFVFKSRWELAYAKYLDENMQDWECEPSKFILDGYINTPDFRVNATDRVEYHEIKGWLDDRTVMRIEAFVRKYSDRKLKILGPAEMVSLGLIEGYYVNYKMAAKVSALRHKIEGEQ